MASSARIDELRKKFDENPRRYFAPLANEYRKAGDLEQAIFICQEYLPQQPGHMSGHIVYGQALFELSRFDEARAVFETALSLDPENLIALRHLGDIARQAGDLRGARSWYQRVLEADPRNEEIAQIMLTVLTTPHDAQPAVPTSGTDITSGFESGASYESTSVQGSADGGFPLEKAEDGSGLAVGPELSQLAERQPEPESIRRSPETIPDDELLDLNDFSVGEVSLSSLSSVPVEAPPAEPFVETGPAFESFSAEPEVVASASDVVFERSEDGPTFEADPYAIAAAADVDVDQHVAESDEPPPLPPESFGTDIVLGLPDDGTAPSLSDTHDAAVLDGLVSYSEPSFGLAAETASAMEVESFFDLPTEQPPANQHDETLAASTMESGWTPDAAIEAPEEFVAASIVEPVAATEPSIEVDLVAEPVEEPEPEAFVTETMAELYLQQGHLEAALDIYQRLADQRPGDDYLRERILAVADAIHEASSAASHADVVVSYGSAAEDVIDDVFDDVAEDGAVLAGPTIREFLSGILRPQAFVAAEETIQHAPTPVSLATFEDVDFGDVDFGGTTIDHSALDDTPLDPADFGQPVFSQGMAPTLDDSVFDTSAYGDAPSLGETAMYETPAFGATPAHAATPVFGASVSDETPSHGLDAVEEPAPTFEESPQEATTLEIDLSGAEFQSLASPAAGPLDSQESIDEEFGADADDWQQNAAVEVQPEASNEDAESPIESIEPPPAVLSRPTPSSSETVTGSIDALFSGADASTVDSTAASTLAQAFASEMPETPPLQGMPAHRATDELSLDHVFKSNPAPRQETEGEGFSFDQFFAEDMSEAAPRPGAEPTSSAAPGAGSDDIAQFNNWLNGLKKT